MPDKENKPSNSSEYGDISKIVWPDHNQFTEKDELKHLLEYSKYDVLNSYSFDIEGYKDIRAYELEFFMLRLQFKIADIRQQLTEYARGYVEGYKSDLRPYIDTPENRKQRIIDLLESKNRFPIVTTPKETGSQDWVKTVRSELFYLYGLEVGKQRQAWEIVFDNKKAFTDFLDARFKDNPGKHPELPFAKNKPKKEIVLRDIWKGEAKNYELLLSYLQFQCSDEGHGQPFILKTAEGYIWNQYPARGWQSYLAGMLYVLSELKLISLSDGATNSAPKLITIVANTFNLSDVSPDAFQKVHNGSISNTKYTAYFEKILEFK